MRVFEYMDYRAYLKDKCGEMRRERPYFSYRWFNRKAGIKSSGFLKLVMDGKRNLAEQGIRGIAKGFSLDAKERKYFELLVRFNQAGSPEDKNDYFRELSENKEFKKAHPLTEAQYALFSHWYYPVLLEMIRFKTGEKKNAKWIARQINPPVPLRDINQAVKKLKALGLIVVDDNGNLSGKEAMLSTPDEVQSILVGNFHVQMSELAAKSVTTAHPADRELSSLTTATTPAGFQRAKKEIQEFRKKLHSILEAAGEGEGQMVAHLNLQLFKLSRDDPKRGPR
ncbi:MAG: TIGR02147 family protein [Deltaproteobacteria bacterium]|nr:TIGR02147 family protein [Deltaproteobacteria bacterium]